jgi:predicted TIM-barrel fold metal-dependent hydrolase
MIAPSVALEELDRLGLDEAGRERYLRENARRVFGLGEREPSPAGRLSAA